MFTDYCEAFLFKIRCGYFLKILWNVYVQIQLITLKEGTLIWKKTCKGNQFLCRILMTKYIDKTAKKNLHIMCT